MKKVLSALMFLISVSSSSAQMCNPVSIVDVSSQEVVWPYTDACPIQYGDYADNPVRPFLIGDINNPTVYWFASNDNGYFKAVGVPVAPGVPDILAQIQRVHEGGQCVSWLTSVFNTTPNEYLDALYNYHSEIWMVAPYTPDGQIVYALVHNEYHIIPSDNPDSYGNLVSAVSTDGANTFNFNINPTTGSNMPVIVAPYPYGNYPEPPQMGAGTEGMFAQSNIIKWGQYYYILVEQYLPQIGQPETIGTCIYRTPDLNNPRGWRGWRSGQGYVVPVVHAYPGVLQNPTDYLCTPVLDGNYRFSWTYNVVLHAFIIVGIDLDYPLDGQNVEAIVYTIAQLNPKTGELTPANGAVGFQEYYLRTIVWLDQWEEQQDVDGESYPSLLDPTSPLLTDPTNANVLPNDRNFQYSGAHPYLYYTYLFPVRQNHGNDRDVARQELLVQNCTS